MHTITLVKMRSKTTLVPIESFDQVHGGLETTNQDLEMEGNKNWTRVIGNTNATSTQSMTTLVSSCRGFPCIPHRNRPRPSIYVAQSVILRMMPMKRSKGNGVGRSSILSLPVLPLCVCSMCR